MPTPRFGWPVAADLSAFNGDNQMAAIYAAVESRLSESVATASGLPVSTARPHGHPITALDTNVIYQATPSGWRQVTGSFAGKRVNTTVNVNGQIVAGSFASIPTVPLSTTVVTPVACVAKVTVRFITQVTAVNAGFMYAVKGTGATTITPGSVTADINTHQFLTSVAMGGQTSVESTAWLSLSAGTTTLELVAQTAGAAATRYIGNIVMMIEPVL